MAAVRVQGAEDALTAVLERCHDAATQLGVRDKSALPPGYRGYVGHFPVYFPEEIPHAGRLIPVNVLGGGNKTEARLADARMGSFVCSICRSTTELGLNGSLKGLDAFVTHPICDAAKHLAGIWGRNFPDQPGQILYLPQNVNTEGAIEYTRDEYRRLKADMERWSAEPITDAALRGSIRLYNRNRRLMRELYAIRREEPWRVSCTESYLLVRARTRMLVQEHNELLAEALEAIRRRETVAQDKPRVVFMGGFCEQPPLEMLETIDDACYVVDDDLLIGLRWLTEDVAETGDPLWALAKAFVDSSAASPVQHDARKPKEQVLMQMIRDSRADAALLTAAKFCEPGLDEQVAWSKHLDKERIPHLVLEFEEKMTSFEQMAMQIETFAESLLFEFV